MVAKLFFAWLYLLILNDFKLFKNFLHHRSKFQEILWEKIVKTEKDPNLVKIYVKLCYITSLFRGLANILMLNFFFGFLTGIIWGLASKWAMIKLGQRLIVSSLDNYVNHFFGQAKLWKTEFLFQLKFLHS